VIRTPRSVEHHLVIITPELLEENVCGGRNGMFPGDVFDGPLPINGSEHFPFATIRGQIDVGKGMGGVDEDACGTLRQPLLKTDGTGKRHRHTTAPVIDRDCS
jgi:hypothetical protein